MPPGNMPEIWLRGRKATYSPDIAMIYLRTYWALRLGVVVQSLAMVFGCGGQKARGPVTSAVGLTIYGADGVPGASYSEEDIARMRAYECDPDEVRAIFPHVMYREGKPLFKGSRLGVLRLANGQDARIAISYYGGGFFGVLGEPGYYVFVGPGAEKWEDLRRTAFTRTQP
jgi:hypothetical protein